MAVWTVFDNYSVRLSMGAPVSFPMTEWTRKIVQEIGTRRGAPRSACVTSPATGAPAMRQWRPEREGTRRGAPRSACVTSPATGAPAMRQWRPERVFGSSGGAPLELRTFRFTLTCRSTCRCEPRRLAYGCMPPLVASLRGT